MRLSLVALLLGMAVPEISEAFNLFSTRRIGSKSLVPRPIATEKGIETVSFCLFLTIGLLFVNNL